MTISIACTLKLCIEHKSTDLIAFVNAKDFILGEQRKNNPHYARFFCKSIKISERLFYTAGKRVETVNRLIVLEQNDCFYAVLGLEMKYVR